MTKDCDCEACVRRREARANGTLPPEIPDEEIEELAEKALLSIMLARMGLDSKMSFAILMNKNSKTGEVLPVLGLYNRDPAMGFCWVPLLVFINFDGEAQKWNLCNADEGSMTMTVGEFQRLSEPPKGEPS